MLDRKEMGKLARARLKDAQVLLDGGRWDGASYLCGYAVELGLKARICRTLGWAGFPDKSSEFQDLSSYKTHKLEVLLHLSGAEERIKTNMLADWSIVSAWSPESRYTPIGKVTEKDVRDMIASARTLLRRL